MQEGSVLSAGTRTTFWHGTAFPRPAWRLTAPRVENSCEGLNSGIGTQVTGGGSPGTSLAAAGRGEHDQLRASDLPVVRSSKFELVINHQTARMLGITVREKAVPSL